MCVLPSYMSGSVVLGKVLLLEPGCVGEQAGASCALPGTGQIPRNIFRSTSPSAFDKARVISLGERWLAACLDLCLR